MNLAPRIYDHLRVTAASGELIGQRSDRTCHFILPRGLAQRIEIADTASCRFFINHFGGL